jgi:hypothetical protein
MAEVAAQLLQALRSLGESSQFCVSGSVDPILPGLEITGVGPVGVPISPATARQLIEQATQAPYGRGEETIIDTNVRRVWQIEPKQFALHNTAWDTLLAGIVDRVRKELGIKGRVDAELYKLLIYETGSFFAPHRDTEKVAGMFGTLIVCLPSPHEGGTLIVTHNGESKEIEFGGAGGEYKLQYVAFYADCWHEIKPVTDGYRVCLVYNLALAQRKHQPGAPRPGDKVEAVAQLLAQLFADTSRQKLAMPLKHKYTEAGLSFDMLKGADRVAVDVLRRAAEQLKYHLYLALLTYRQEGSPDEETVRYNRWGQVVTSSAEMGEVYHEKLVLDGLVDAVGQEAGLGEMVLSEDDIVSETAFEDFPFTTEVSEATGNEGATVERWYRQAAIAIWPPDRFFSILAGQGQAASIPALAKLIAQSKDPSRDESCRTLAREIIHHWKAPGYGRKDAPHTTAMLQHLEQVADPALVTSFIQDVLPKDYRGTEGQALSRLAERLGWDRFGEGLTRFVSLQLPGTAGADLAATVSIVEGLCCSLGDPTAQRTTVCRAVAGEMEQTVRKWDTHKEAGYWFGKDAGRKGVIEALTRTLGTLDEGNLLERFLAHALADKPHYALHEVLIPAVKAIYGWTTKGAIEARCAQQIRDHCIAELERLTEKPAEEPKDWAQDVVLRCHCADCRELQQFLRDPRETIHRFRAAEARRQHLSSQLQVHHCDMDHETERKGSPYTLVCTKNRKSYDRQKREFAKNEKLLAELRGLERAKKKK